MFVVSDLYFQLKNKVIWLVISTVTLSVAMNLLLTLGNQGAYKTPTVF